MKFIFLAWMIIQKSLAKKRVVMLDYCQTPECLMISQRTLDFVDPTADPCVDFHQAACGGYKKSKIIKNEWGINLMVNEYTNNRVKGVLRDFDINPSNEIQRSVSNFLKKCLASTETDKQQFVDYVNSEMGGYPMFNKSWNPQNFNLTRILTSFPSPDYGIFEIESNVIRLNTTNSIPFLYIHHGTLLDDFTNKIMGILNELAPIFDGQLDDESIQQDIDDLKEFTHMIKTNRTEHKEITSTMIQEKLIQFDLPLLLNVMFNIESLDDFAFLIYEHLFENLHKYLGDTKPKTLANFFITYMYYSIRQAYGFVPFKSDEYKSYSCLRVTRKIYKYVINPAVIQKYFQEDYEKNKKIVGNMIDEILNEYRDVFEKSEWLDEETRKGAKRKIDEMIKFIGYPPELMNPDFINDLYSRFKFSETDNYIQTLIKGCKVDSILSYFTNGKLLSSDYLKDNAFYQPGKNTFTLLIPYATKLMVDSLYPENLHYAVVGSTIGHEIGHAFDSKGKNFNEFGLWKNWWSNKTTEEFDRRSKCFIDQFNQVKFKNFETPEDYGQKKLGEVLADHMGIYTAFQAYRKAKLARKRKMVIAGLGNYTDNQLFFYFYAQSMCSVHPILQETFDSSKYDTHPHDIHRVNDILSNMDDFEETFKCKKKENKCKLFDS